MSEQVPASDTPRHLRPLLPAPTRRPQPPPRPSKPGRGSQAQVPAACDACRKQKCKCFGERPACRRCVQRRIRCRYAAAPGETSSQALRRNYDDLRNRATAHEEIVELLKSLPDQEAHHVLQKIRAGTDITSILSHIKAGDLLLQMSVLPETRFRYKFPYRSDMPEDYIPNNPYLDSFIYDVASLYPVDQSPSPSNSSSVSAVDEYHSLYQKPFHAAHVVDARLSEAKPSLWTAVCDDDVLMRELIGVWLRCEYQFTAAFQKDLFLEDMAAKREDFCSSLLVNMILAYSCVCWPQFSNRAEYWNPNTLQYRFLAEAKRLWEVECSEPRITTIQTGMLLNVFYNLCGLDEIGQAYRIHAISLAHELRLFDGRILGQSSRIRHGRLFTAWSLYSWEALVGFSFMFPPLLREPPHEPLPDPSEDEQWYGETWVRYPLNQTLSPSYFGQVFRAKCQFRIIMNEFCHLAYSKGSNVTLSKANKLLSRLRGWYNDLPHPLRAKTIVLPNHLQLHMYYQNLILALYEPLLDVKTVQEPSPHQIVAEATKYIQTLVRLYYLRHGFESMDLFIVIPLVLAGFECIEAIGEETPVPKLEALRSTLMLIATGLYSQRRNHHLAQALFRVIRGRMRPHEAAILRGILNLEKTDAEEDKAPMQTVRSHWPVKVVKKEEELDSVILANLVENYAHMNVEDDFAAP
ncbi:hypothetical protein JX266_011420 [Neoarthrinium moseri]|nr:hypothetical protein JX266_011420 [Neoarthrinium moseri]